jgi:hypothetical protein
MERAHRAVLLCSGSALLAYCLRKQNVPGAPRALGTLHHGFAIGDKRDFPRPRATLAVATGVNPLSSEYPFPRGYPGPPVAALASLE